MPHSPLVTLSTGSSSDHPAPLRSLAQNLVRAVLLLTMIGSVALVTWLSWRETTARREAFTESCRSNTSFIRGLRLRPTEKLAAQLTALLGVQVSFPLRRQDAQTLPLTFQGMETVRLPLDDWTDVQFSRPSTPFGSILTRSQTWLALGLFWGVALLLAALLGRGLVRPLTELSQQVPLLLAGTAPTNTLATRQDEIGSLARALHDAGCKLNAERAKRLTAERLAVLARIATGLAHEIKNPLSAIQLHAQLLPDSTETTEAVSHILQQTHAIEDLVNQWLFLARPEPPGTSELLLRDLFANLVSLHQPRASHAEVQIHWDVPDHPITLMADRSRLLQALGNLLVNAIQASPTGGTLRLTATLCDDSRVQIRLTDEGPGFSPAALLSGTELFFSEKEGGMGVGLNIAHQLIQAHGGTLELSNQSAPAHGGLVTLTLPTA
jgi:signal transduction histidine kinase